MSNKFSIDDLTLGEIDVIEQLAGVGIGALSSEERPKAKMLQAVSYVIQRRTVPSFTMADAANLTLKQMQEITGLGDEADDAPKDEPVTVEATFSAPSFSTPTMPTPSFSTPTMPTPDAPSFAPSGSTEWPSS